MTTSDQAHGVVEPLDDSQESLAPPGTVENDKPEEAKSTKKALTEYHVLELVGSSGADETYKIVARNVKAASRVDAVKKSGITLTEEKRHFIAPTSRSMELIPGYLEVPPPRSVIG